MIRVLIAAASPVVRAGLKTLVAQVVDFVVAGCASAGDLVELAMALHPDVILWQVAADEDAGAALRLLERQNTVLLTSNAALDLIRAGVHGVLPLDASAERIEIALRAAAAGLGVFSPEHLVEPPPAHRPTARKVRLVP